MMSNSLPSEYYVPMTILLVIWLKHLLNVCRLRLLLWKFSSDTCVISQTECAPKPIALTSQDEQDSVLHPGFQIVFDNLNFHQTVRHKTLDNKNKQFNLVHAYAVIDRVNCEHLDNSRPQARVEDLPNATWFMSTDDHQLLKDELNILWQRAIVKFMPCFQHFAPVVAEHIPHEYLQESTRKSEIVSSCSICIRLVLF